MFLLTRPDGNVVDVDAIWTTVSDLVSDPYPPSLPGEEAADAARFGLMLGLRLAFDEPEFATLVMKSYEQHARPATVLGTTEEVEQVAHSLVAAVLEHLTLKG